MHESRQGQQYHQRRGRSAIKTVGDPAYRLKLFQRVITVSLEKMKIVNALPKLGV